MEIIYFIILIIGIFVFSLSVYKKNKKNSNIYIVKEKNDEKSDLDKEPEENDSEDEKSDNSEFDTYKFNIAYYWITQKVQKRKNIDYDKLKEKIILNFQNVPEILEDSTTHVQEDQIEFLTEVLGHVDYSSPLKYRLVNRGRKYSNWIKNLLLLAAVIFFILFQIEIRKDTDEHSMLYLVLAVSSLFLSFVFGKLTNFLLSALLKTLKPGDYIKILDEPDEQIEQTIKINQLKIKQSTFNETTVFLSKKRMLCEDFISQSSNYLNTINNKLCLYLVIDYLKTYYSKEAYREYLLEKEVDVLEFISAFNPRAVSANFELAMVYLERKRFEDFYETLLKCREINGYDCMIESFIKTYEFCIANCNSKEEKK